MCEAKVYANVGAADRNPYEIAIQIKRQLHEIERHDLVVGEVSLSLVTVNALAVTFPDGNFINGTDGSWGIYHSEVTIDDTLPFGEMRVLDPSPEHMQLVYDELARQELRSDWQRYGETCEVSENAGHRRRRSRVR